MKRTVKEILSAPFEDVRTLRTHPRFPCVSLMSNGVLMADVPRMTPISGCDPQAARLAAS